MKKFRFFLAMLAVMLVFGLAFVGCDNNTTGGDSSSSQGAPTVTIYNVIYNKNGGNGTTPSTQRVNAGSSITLANGSGLSRSGCNFGGWNTNSSGTGVNYPADSSYTPTANITLYAKWDNNDTTNPDGNDPAINTYTVTFNANGADGTVPSPLTILAGSSITLPSQSGLIKNGYNFSGWNTNFSGTGVNYPAGSSYTPTANITLYAKWDNNDTTIPDGNDPAINTYTVTFNANGAEGTVPSPLTILAGSSITLPSQSGLIKNGYNFSGWNTTSSGTGTTFSVGQYFTPTWNTTFYALWIKINETSSGLPEAPTGVTATVISDSCIRVSWNAVPGAEYYSVQYIWEWVSSGIWNGIVVRGTTFEYYSLSVGLNYYFRVIAINNVGMGSPSAIVQLEYPQ